MSAVFIKIFNLGITAGWIVLAVLLLRPLLKRAPKWINCLLWGIVGLRLIFPFSLESIFSLIPSAEPLPEDITFTETPEINSGIGVLNDTVNPIISDSLSPTVGYSANPMQIVVGVASYLWVIGIALILIYGVVSYIRLALRVRVSVKQSGNIYFCDEVDSPFILGVFRPRIYLPSGIGGEEMEFVVAHEKAHLRRGDHLWKPLGFMLLAVYWFNPLLWIAYVLLCRDIEMACDEKVIKLMDSDAKKGYSEALLSCSVHRRSIMACPLAFGEVGVKQRIKSVLNYKKPAFWIIIIALVATLVVSICFLTYPRDNVRDLLEPGSEWASEGDVTVNVAIEDSRWMTGTLSFGGQNYDIVIHYFYESDSVCAEILKAEISDQKYESDNELISSDEYNKWYEELSAEHLLVSGVLKSRRDDFVLKIETDNLGIGQKEIVFKKTKDSGNKTVKLSADEDETGAVYINVLDCGSTKRSAKVSFVQAKLDGGDLVFVLKWKNNSFHTQIYGNSFEVYRYEGDELVALEFIGAWQEAAVGVSAFSLTYPSFNITEHYDISGIGKYRLCAGAAWVDFEVSDKSSPGSQFPYEIGVLGNGLCAAVTGFGCETENIDIELKQVKREDGDIVFTIVWSNSGTTDYIYGQPFEIFRYDANGGLEKLEVNGASSDPDVYPVWEAIAYLVLPDSESVHDYNITDYYDISLPGKYRFECEGAWVDFEVVNTDDGETLTGVGSEETNNSGKTGKTDTASENLNINIDSLKAIYPDYFGLDASNGLDVYVWQMGSGGFDFGLLPYAEDRKLYYLRGASAEEMRAILSTYDISEDKIRIVPWQNPLSSYIGDYWMRWVALDDVTPYRNMYIAMISDMIFGDTVRTKYPNVYESQWFDVDGDGEEEYNLVGIGLVDGKFMFSYIVSEDGKTAEYSSTFYTEPMGLKFFTSSDGTVRLRGRTDKGEVRIFDISVKNGRIELTENSSELGYFETAHSELDFSKADFSLVDRVIITDGITGEKKYFRDIMNRNNFNAVLGEIKKIKGSDPVSNRGYSGFRYRVELYYDTQLIYSFSIFYDDAEGARLICGYYETVDGFDYPCRYKLTNPAYEELINALGKYVN